MLAKALKKFGNSRCLPLDKTLLAILGIEYDSEKVIISIDKNRLIIEKAPIFEEQTEFVLNKKLWEEFNNALNTPVKANSLKNLLNTRGVLDE